MVRAWLVLCACVILWPEASVAGNPQRKWFTIETEHFAITSYTPLEPVAERVARVAERAHGVLVQLMQQRPSERTQVLLIDDTDSANGFATAVPRNQIVLYATAPSASSGLADHDDWLYLLFAHEYTHIVHLDTIGRPARWVNRIFGKTWAPNQIQPRWVIEGLATYQESNVTSGGRLRNTEFLAVLRTQALADRLLRLDQTTGFPRDVPRGNAAYLYGSHFLAYVFDALGRDVPAKMSRASSREPLPFAVNRQLTRAAGETFQTMYERWLRHVSTQAWLIDEAVARRGRREGRALTTDGETNLSPAFGTDGSVYWFRADGQGPPRIVKRGSEDTREAPRDVMTAPNLGAWTLLRDGSIVYEQTRVVERDHDYQDLMIWDRPSGKTYRLTHGQRARDPAISPDEKQVAFVGNSAQGSWLYRMPLVPGATPHVVWRGSDYEQVSAPAWSPDGTTIAMAVWRTGGARDIGIVDIQTGTLRWVTNDRAQDGSPAWSPTGAYLYFDSDRTGVRNIYAWREEDASVWQVTNVSGGASDAAISSDGARLLFHGLVATGTNIYAMVLDPARFLAADSEIDARPPPTVVDQTPTWGQRPRPYRARDTLGPQSWTTGANFTSFSSTLSAQTQGTDVAGLHAYAAAVTWNLDQASLGLGGFYGYDGWWLPLRLSVARRAQDRPLVSQGDQIIRTPGEVLSATVSVGLPAEVRPGQTVTTSLDYDIDWSRAYEATLPPPDPTDDVQRPLAPDDVAASLGLRASLGRSRGALYTTGPSEGVDASAALRIEHPSLGASGRSLSFTWAATGYWKVPRLCTATTSLRWAGGFRAGDTGRTGGFSLGSAPTQDVVTSLFDSTRFGNTGYLRGFDPRTLTGSQFHLLNGEWRQEVMSLERGLATLPFYLKRLHAAVLWDVGAAHDGLLTRDDVRTSLGTALRLDTVLGYFVPGTLEVGAARGFGAGGKWETWFLLTGTI